MPQLKEFIFNKINKIQKPLVATFAAFDKSKIVRIILLLLAITLCESISCSPNEAESASSSDAIKKLKSDDSANPQAQVMQEILAQMPTREELLKAQPDDYVEGDKNAPNVIIEYSSLGCAHCATYHFEVLPQIKHNFIDKGKVFYIYRDFPINAQSFSASIIATCGSKLQSNYMAWINQLFQSQISWLIPSKDYLDKLLNIAKLNGLKREDFDKCIADKELALQIGKRVFYAEKVLDVRYTPTIFINGRYMEGHATYQHIVKELNLNQQ